MSRKDKELDLIMDEVETAIKKPKQKVEDMDKVTYKNTMASYNAEIKKLKLLKKQAKLTYKISKLSEA